MNNRLIRNFTFNKAIRSSLIFSDTNKIRLNTEGGDIDGKIQLKIDSNGFYPLDADIHIETPFMEPQGVQKWLRFEASVVEDPATSLLPDAFSLGFKIKTTAGNLYWDGLAWVSAGISDWNTEQEINDNIDTLPIATIGNKKIGFILNLVTTDDRRTPEVLELKILGEFDIEFFEDLVYDTVIRKLNTDFRSSSVVVFPSDGSASFDLNAIMENKGYNITGIKKVVDQTDDSLELINLFDSYVQGSRSTTGPGASPWSSSRARRSRRSSRQARWPSTKR